MKAFTSELLSMAYRSQKLTNAFKRIAVKWKVKSMSWV